MVALFRIKRKYIPFVALSIIGLSYLIFTNVRGIYFSFDNKRDQLLSKLATDVVRNFQTIKPNCDRFTSYREPNMEKYWQYYGYDDYDLKLTPEDYANKMLVITKSQEEELARINNLLINQELDDSSLIMKGFNELLKTYYESDSNGIVYVSGDNYYWLTLMSVKYIRAELKDDVPIEIFIPFKNHISERMEEIICKKFENVYFSYFSDFLSSKTLQTLSGFQYKSLALLLSRFTNILYLDADNFLIQKSDKLFRSTTYLKNGMICWPDFWKRSTHPTFYKINEKLNKLSGTIHSTPSVENGELLINKKTHIKTLLLAFYYNLYGPDYFYPLFSQGFPGQGDKETFYLAVRAIDEKVYLPTGMKTKIAGYIDNTNKFSGQCILQQNPDDNNEASFFHCNYPKMNLDEMKDDYVNRRSWSIIRPAKKENNGGGHISFLKHLGYDLELNIWKNINDLLTKDFSNVDFYKASDKNHIVENVNKHIEFLKQNH